jgi:hypothetical protein
MPTCFYNTQPVGFSFDYVEKFFPIPFYEKKTLQYEQDDHQTVISGLVLDSLDRVRDFFLIHSDQDGWYLDCEMFFQTSFLFTFKKAKLAVTVIGRIHDSKYVNVEIYIKH